MKLEIRFKKNYGGFCWSLLVWLVGQCLLRKQRPCNSSKVRPGLFQVCRDCNSRHDLESTKDHQNKHRTPKAAKIMTGWSVYCELNERCLSRLRLGFREKGKKRNSSPLIKREPTPRKQRPCFLLPNPWSKVSSREGQRLIFPITSSSFLLLAKIESLMELPFPLF